MINVDTEQTEELELKLTRLYVALTMTRNVVEQDFAFVATEEASRSVATLVNVASEILEEILDPQLTQLIAINNDVTEMELVM